MLSVFIHMPQRNYSVGCKSPFREMMENGYVWCHSIGGLSGSDGVVDVNAPGCGTRTLFPLILLGKYLIL